MKFRQWAVLSALLFSACTSPSIKQSVDLKTFWKRDIRLTVNGQTAFGVIMVNPSPSFDIRGNTTQDIDRLVLKTCHRNPDMQVDNNGFRYIYQPNEIEYTNGIYCDIELGGFSKDGLISYGKISFADPAGVPAKILCDGDIKLGTSTVCQAKAGTIQQIEFTEEMHVSLKSLTCDFGKILQSDGKKFQYVMPARECVISFVTSSDLGARTHRHETVGYEDKLLRND